MMSQVQTHQSYSPSEAARRLRIRPFRLREMLKRGEGPEYSVEGTRVRYRRDALKQWAMDALCINPAWFDL